MDKTFDLQMEVNDKNILISKLKKEVERYLSQIKKSPWLKKNVTSKTNISQYSDTPSLCQNPDTLIKPITWQHEFQQQKIVKLNAHKRNWRIKLLMLKNRTTKNIRNREYSTITQIRIQTGTPIQIQITLHL